MTTTTLTGDAGWTAVSGSKTGLFDIGARSVSWSPDGGANGVGCWVVAGESTTGVTSLAVSLDISGTSWRAIRDTNSLFSVQANALTFTGTNWVAGGEGVNTLIYSSDVSGLVWNIPASSPFTTRVSGLTYAGTMMNNTQKNIPNFYLRIGTTDWWRLVVIPTGPNDQGIDKTSNLQAWGHDMQFYDAGYTGSNQVMQQFRYFAEFYLTAYELTTHPTNPNGFFQVTVYMANVFPGTTFYFKTDGNGNFQSAYQSNYAYDTMNWNYTSDPTPNGGYAAGLALRAKVPGVHAVGSGGATTAYSLDRGITWTNPSLGLFNDASGGGLCAYYEPTQGEMVLGGFSQDNALNSWVANNGPASGFYQGKVGTTPIFPRGVNAVVYGGNTPIHTKAANAVTWNGVRWVSGGEGTNPLATSADGVSWAPVVNSNVDPFPNNAVVQGVAGNSRIGLTPADSMMMMIDDGGANSQQFDFVSDTTINSGVDNVVLTVQSNPV
jgi:hypothetical protein